MPNGNNKNSNDMGEKIDQILERFYKKDIDLLEVRKELLILFSVISRLSDEDITKIAQDKCPITNGCFGEHDFTEGKQEGFEEGIIYVRDELLNGF